MTSFLVAEGTLESGQLSLQLLYPSTISITLWISVQADHVLSHMAFTLQLPRAYLGAQGPLEPAGVLFEHTTCRLIKSTTVTIAHRLGE